MTPVFCCGFECGVEGTAGHHWDIQGTGSFDTTTVRSGARSLRLNPTASGTSSATNSYLASITRLVGRFYIHFTTLPSADTQIFLLGTVGTSAPGVRFKQSDSKIYAGSGATLGASGVAVTTGQWYRIDFDLVQSAGGNETADVQVDGVACGQASAEQTASSYVGFRIAFTATVTADAYFDDFIVSQTGGDYPIGAGFINHFVPTADGTHNIAGTGDFQRTLTGTDILNATTTAFQLVDEVPLEATVTDWINMLAPINATDYVECIFGPAPGILVPVVGPRTVEVICGINQAGTGAGNMEIRLNDNGTMGTIYTATGVAGVAVATGQQFKRAHFADPPSAASAWNANNDGGNGDFRDLRIRFGSPAALDVNPDQYFGCAMIEAEFAMELPHSFYGGRPMGESGQNQMNQLLIQ